MDDGVMTFFSSLAYLSPTCRCTPKKVEYYIFS